MGVTEVQRFPLGKVFIRGRKGAVMTTKIISQEFVLVPLEETINKLVNHPDYVKLIRDGNGSSSDSKCLDSYMKGELAKDNSVLQKHPDALRFILYYDDFEVCSPLKSRAGKNKIGAFYLFLDNIPPKFRSSLKVICLLGLVNANFIKGQYYGMDAALEIIVKEFKRFEEGVTLSCGQKVYGTLIATIGDNLGQHCLGGFKEGFTAHPICRFCMARYEVELITMTREDASLLRSKEEYEKQICQIQTERGKNEKASKEFGLNRESCLNRLETFHVLKNMPPDLLHDLLEGSLSFTLKKLLHHYLYDQVVQKPFTLDWLNQSIQSYDFDYSEIKDKPSELKAEYIKDNTSVSLHQSAAQLWLLATILPLILYAHIDPEDAHWENFLDILEICRVCFTLEFPRHLVLYLRDLTDKYLTNFISLYGALIPKQHFMTHYPTLILRLGSLVNYACMRCEANHKYYKKLVAHIASFRNITLHLARRDQLHQSYLWLNSLWTGTNCGPLHTVHLNTAIYGMLLNTACGEVIETSWLELNGLKFKPERCYVVVGMRNHLPLFALVKHVIVYPEVAFVCQETVTVCRNVLAACFIVSPTNALCIKKPGDLVAHSVFHAHSFSGELAIVTKYCIGGEP